MPISPIIPTNNQAIKELQTQIAKNQAMQVESTEDLSQYLDIVIFNPLQDAQRFRNLKDLVTKEGAKPEESEEVEPKILNVGKVDEASERFQKNNYELNAKTLKILHSQLTKGDTAEKILQKVGAVYSDASLADEALEFLAEVTEAQLQAATLEAKEKLNKLKGKEIRAGRNMGAQAREFAEQGLGSPTSLRDLYRDIILNPRDPLKLFDELTERFRYPKLKSAITFMLHSLGSDLKSKGPSIQRGELKRLLDETRSMQGILGVFRFFQSRMKLIQREFNSYELMLPPRMDFELLARVFGKIMAEKFINADKLVQTAKPMGIAEEVAAQIIIFSQMRDALKQIAPRYFRDPRHKDELLKAFLDAIETLEDVLEKEGE